MRLRLKPKTVHSKTIIKRFHKKVTAKQLYEIKEKLFTKFKKANDSKTQCAQQIIEETVCVSNLSLRTVCE